MFGDDKDFRLCFKEYVRGMLYGFDYSYRVRELAIEGQSPMGSLRDPVKKTLHGPTPYRRNLKPFALNSLKSPV